MPGHIEKYHYGQYADVGRLWLIASDADGGFTAPVICPNCESTNLANLDNIGHTCCQCALDMVPFA